MYIINKKINRKINHTVSNTIHRLCLILFVIGFGLNTVYPKPVIADSVPHTTSDKYLKTVNLNTVEPKVEPINISGIAIQSIQLIRNTTNNSLDLHTQYRVNLPDNIAELAQSAPLYFVFDWAIKRPRWYWYDKRLAGGRVYWRLSYNRLIQKWRISTATSLAGTQASFSLTFNTLSEVLTHLRYIRRDTVIKFNQLDSNERYELTTRLYLADNLLPKPFQLNIMNDRDWSLDSGLTENTLKIVPAGIGLIRK